jgi:hypothetical protein
MSMSFNQLLVLGGVAAGQGQQGRPGVDGQAIEQFEADLADNLYKIWNVRNEC